MPGTSRVKVPESTLIRYHERCRLIYVDNRMVAMESESAMKCVTNSLAESTSDGTDLPKAVSTLAVQFNLAPQNSTQLGMVIVGAAN